MLGESASAKTVSAATAACAEASKWEQALALLDGSLRRRIVLDPWPRVLTRSIIVFISEYKCYMSYIIIS